MIAEFCPLFCPVVPLLPFLPLQLRGCTFAAVKHSKQHMAKHLFIDFFGPSFESLDVHSCFFLQNLGKFMLKSDSRAPKSFFLLLFPNSKIFVTTYLSCSLHCHPLYLNSCYYLHSRFHDWRETHTNQVWSTHIYREVLTVHNRIENQNKRIN